MAKTPKTTKSPKPKKVAEEGAPAPAPAKVAKPKKAAKPKAPKSDAPARAVVMHGETRLVHADDAAAAVLQSLTTMIDAVHAAGRVLITSATHANGVSTLHAVLPGHPTPYDQFPGLILGIDPEGLLTFDHVIIGYAGAGLVEDAAFSLLSAMQPEDEGTGNQIGRHADWFDRAVLAAEDAGSRHAGVQRTSHI